MMMMMMMMMAVNKVLILLAAAAGLSARVAAAAGAGGIYVYAPDLSDFDTVELCSDTCVGVKPSFFETVCEDGGPSNGTDYPGSMCALGTDCSACGPGVYASFSSLEDAVGNFTSADGVFEGSLFIEDTHLTSLDGIQAVKSVNGSLSVRYNALLEDISALQSLESIDGFFYLQNNLLSSTLDGVDALATVGANFLVDNNSALESITAESLVSVGGGIGIKNNAQLRHLSLNALETIGSSAWGAKTHNDYLSVFENFSLEKTVFPALAHVQGQLNIFYNYNLTAVELNSLETCSSFALITNNLGRTSPLTGFNTLHYVANSTYAVGFLDLGVNPLTAIDDAFNSVVAVDGGVYVGDNYQSFREPRNPPLESFTNSFRSLASIGGELYVNMTDSSGFSDTLGALETVGDCCTLIPASLLEKLPACEGKLCEI